MKPRLGVIAALGLVLLSACASAPTVPNEPDDLIASLRPLCGKAFAGTVIEDMPAAPAPNPFAGRTLVMHVRECDRDALRIPFHVGDDRSRTWVLTRTPTGLRLKHDHRHADGTPDALTLYGGDSAPGSSATRVDFPADAESKTLFEREGRAVSIHNTWTLEHAPGVSFHYRLQRPDGRRFTVRFDLTQPVATPPAPWGAPD